MVAFLSQHPAMLVVCVSWVMGNEVCRTLPGQFVCVCVCVCVCV